MRIRFSVHNNRIGIELYGDESYGNYINESYITDNTQVGLFINYSDNNTVYKTDFNENKYGISFSRAANGNILQESSFDDNEDYDIHHGYDHGGVGIPGWENVLIDTEFDDLSIDSDSRLLVKTLIETTIKDNGTYAWNRVNTTLDSDRRANSGTNSFWAGNSDEDEYLSSWNVSFKMNSDITLPSGGIENSSILEIRTWYKTEDTYDGGRVYITKDDGSNWDLLTPLGGYDGLMQDGSDCDNNEKAFMGDKSSLGWHIKKFNLSAYRGEDVKVKFTFCSDSSEEREGWYIDDVKIYKDADSSSVSFFDNFERLGHKWVDARDWVHEGSPLYEGKRDVDIVIIEGTSSEPLINMSINNDMLIHLKMDETGSSSAWDSASSQWWNRYGQSSYGSGLYGNAVTFDGNGDYLRSGYDYVSSSPWRLD